LIKRWLESPKAGGNYDMSTAEEYRSHARECEHMAVDSVTDERRQFLLEIAKIWMLLAVQEEGATTKSDQPTT
jgi:hypothetical protein